MVKVRPYIYFIFALSLIFTFYYSCFEQNPSLSRISRYAEDDFLKSWTLISPMPVSDDIFSVHFANNAVVASMFGGKILYSDNGMMTHNLYDLPNNDVLNEITDFNGYYVGVSSLGKMYKSSDGKGWVEVSGTAINKILTAIAAGDKVVAVGFGGTIISSSDLSSFNKIPVSIQDDLYDIAVSDTNIYVAAGKNSMICRSSDGNIFDCAKSAVGSDILSIAYGKGRFIAVSANNKLMVSDDYGINWSISDLGLIGETSRIEYLNNEFLIYGVDGFIATSLDGGSFSLVDVSTVYDFYDATYDGSLYYFVGPGGLILVSSHPTTGFIRNSPDIVGDLFALYKGNEYFVVGGTDGIVAYSSNGIDWVTVFPSGIQHNIKSISSDGDQNDENYCAVTSNGFAYNTRDPTLNWAEIQVSSDGDLNDITFGLSKFILVGKSGTLYISGNCISFLRVDIGSTANLNRVISDGTNILVAGENGTLYKSTNPSGPYSKVNFPDNYNIVDMAYGNGVYLFLTQEKINENLFNSRIYKSTDLSSFTLAKEYLNTKLTRVASGGGYFIFTSSLGIIYYTKEGQNFSVISTGRYKEILNVRFLDKAFYITGRDALLMKSADNMSGYEPQISVSTDYIDFGEIVVNSSSNLEEIVISNLGEGDLLISSVQISGNDSSQFSIETESCTSSVLSKGNECHIYVEFSPTSTGTKGAKLDILSNDKTHPTYSVDLSGKGITPSSGVISIDKQSIDFGAVKIGTESTSQSITVKNIGTNDLQIASVYLGGDDISNFEIKNDECSNKTVASNNICIISLAFKPGSVGDKKAELLIDSDDPQRPTAKVLLLGSGIDKDYPNIVVDKNQIDFGIVKIGSESSVESLNVTNKGNATLNISDVHIEGVNATDFMIKSDLCKGNLLNPSSSCKIELMFKPQNTGNASAALKILSNDPDTPNYSVNLYGVGRAASGPAINVSPMSLDFQKVNVGSESAAQDILIKSEGDADLSLNISLSGNDSDQFGIKSNNCPLKLAPENQCIVSVIFKPDRSGLKNADLQIVSNDPTFSTIKVALKGEGVLNQPAQISITPSSYNFGKRIIGKVYPSVTFTVKNEGIGNLSIISVSIEGNDGNNFKIESDDCSGNQFAPDGLCYIKVSFNPDDVREYSANLVIKSNDSSSPEVKVSLKGEGIISEDKDAGVINDIFIEEDTGTHQTSDVKSKDESTSGCGCNIVE